MEVLPSPELAETALDRFERFRSGREWGPAQSERRGGRFSDLVFRARDGSRGRFEAGR